MCAKNPFSDIIPYPYDSSLGTSKTEMQYAKTYSSLLNSSVCGIRVFCGDFRKMLRILNGIIVLCGHLEKFWGNLLTL